MGCYFTRDIDKVAADNTQTKGPVKTGPFLLVGVVVVTGKTW